MKQDYEIITTFLKKHKGSNIYAELSLFQEGLKKLKLSMLSDA
jgi:hypothetical protein